MATTLTIDYGSDKVLDSTISHLQLPSGGLTGMTFVWEARKSSTDAVPYLTKTPTITTAGSTTVDGVLSTTLNAADTTALPRYTTVLFWRLLITDTGAKTSIADEGPLVVVVS